MNFDIRTVAFVSSITSLMMFIWMLSLSRTRRIYAGFRHWTLSAFMFFLAMVLISLRDFLPDIVTIILGNTAFLCAFIWIEIGLQSFLGLSQRRIVPALSLAILIVSFSYFTFVVNDVSSRIAIISGLVSFFSIRSAILIFRHFPESLTGSNWQLIVTLGLLATWDIQRVILTLIFEPHETDFMHMGINQSVTLIVFIGGSILLYSGLVMAVAQRVESELMLAGQEIQTLQRFLPICSECKKIRDDQGLWREVEAYIEKHSKASMTHSLCPDCARILYPDIPEKV